MEKEDKILLATIEDKRRQCEIRYAATNTVFLDMRQRALAEAFCKTDRSLMLLSERPDGTYENPDIAGSGRVRALFYGGYADAERRALIFLPDYANLTDFLPLASIAGAQNLETPAAKPQKNKVPTANMQDGSAQTVAFQHPAPEGCPLTLIKAHTAGGIGAKKLTHRDYLGSLMGLGIKRGMIGDIIIRDDGADIIVMKEIADFLLINYEKAGRTNLKLEIADITELNTGIVNIEEKHDTVASLRLDNLVSSVFSLSRSRAQEAIKAGLVFVNSAPAAKPDMQLTEGDKLVLRGRGKAVLRKVQGKTRKDRIYISFDRYL